MAADASGVGLWRSATAAQAQQPPPPAPAGAAARLRLADHQRAGQGGRRRRPRRGQEEQLAHGDRHRRAGRASSSISRRWTAPRTPRPALALAKARTSALFRRPSKAFADQFAAGNTGVHDAFRTTRGRSRPRAASRSSSSGKIIGAIGVERRHRPAGRRGGDRRRQCGEVSAIASGDYGALTRLWTCRLRFRRARPSFRN